MENKTYKNITNLTIRELEKIETELSAFNGNFGAVIIFKTSNKNYLIGKQDERVQKMAEITTDIYNYTDLIYDNYIYRADNLDVLKGWLYGAVQMNNGRI